MFYLSSQQCIIYYFLISALLCCFVSLDFSFAIKNYSGSLQSALCQYQNCKDKIEDEAQVHSMETVYTTENQSDVSNIDLFGVENDLTAFNHEMSDETDFGTPPWDSSSSEGNSIISERSGLDGSWHRCWEGPKWFGLRVLRQNGTN